MVHIFPPPADEIRNGLYSVIAGALAGGELEPSWVAVDDGSGSWVSQVSGRSAAERARGVAAVASDHALVMAQRLGIGGAIWMPPSSLGALEAFAAAASGEAPVARDMAAHELLDDSSRFCVVSFCDRPFWRAQIGDRQLEARLAELAGSLDVPAAVLQWPALVVAGRDTDAIISAWEDLAADGGRVGPAVSVFALGAMEASILDDSYATLTKGPAGSTSPGSPPPQPVHELPHGRRVGWWYIGGDQELEEDGWAATPVEVSAIRCRWRLDGADSSGSVVDVLGTEEVASLEEIAAVRVPGWATCGLRPGSPAGLLVARIAEAAARRGLPLWVPNVDQEGLRLVLGLPGVIWVDGPAVPK